MLTSTRDRCDRIITLIDKCLAEFEKSTSTSTSTSPRTVLSSTNNPLPSGGAGR